MSCSPATQEFKPNPDFLLDVDNIPFGDMLQQQFTQAWTPIFDQIENKKSKSPTFSLKLLNEESDWPQLVEFYHGSYGVDPIWQACHDEYIVPAPRKGRWLAYCGEGRVFAAVTVDSSQVERGSLPVALIEYRE
jgi:hypothetical protein